MSGIKGVFESLKERGEGAYIPYICAGDPNLDLSLKMLETICESGADIIELGIPFSDPMADGPILQEAMNRSLNAGFRINLLFDIIEEMRGRGFEQPVVVMGYFNIINHMGEEVFCERLSNAGGDGIIVVDLPLEENRHLDEICRADGIDLINLITPHTPPDRRKTILGGSSGYVYLVSVAGVTGPRDVLSDETMNLIKEVASISPLPVALGFGISTPAHAQLAFENGASGVVEGSNLANIYSSYVDDVNTILSSIGEHTSSMKWALSFKRR